MRVRCLPLALTTCLCAAFVFLESLPAFALWTTQQETYSLELGGSVRSIDVLIDNYNEPLVFGEDNEYDGISQIIARLTGTGRITDNGSYDVHLVQDVQYSSADSEMDSFGYSGISTTALRYRIRDPLKQWDDDDDVSATLDFDRLNFKLVLGRIDLTVGRQAINFSQAYFWNPLDIFLAFDPETFDRDYKPGVDAIRSDISLGMFSSLTFVYAPGRELTIETGTTGVEVSTKNFDDESWYGSALMGRLRTTIRDWDIVFQGGKIYGGSQIGAGFSGELFEIGLRGEASYVFAGDKRTLNLPDPEQADFSREIELVEDHTAFVIGADYRFDNSLYINVEYLYNSAGDADDLEAGIVRQAIGEGLSLGEQLAGVQVSYDIHPLVTGQIAAIHSFSDASSLVCPLVKVSISDEADLLLGGLLAFGERPETKRINLLGLPIEYPKLESEYGTYPHVYYLEFKFYF